jgi:adenosylcobinamide-phosphate synthase
MAGALDVQLAGDAYYFGVLHKKKTIGDDIRPIEIDDIKRANKLLYASAIVSILVFLAIRFLLLQML